MRFDLDRGGLLVVRRCVSLALVGLVLLGAVRPAHAQAAPERWRPVDYYFLHGSTAIWALALGLAIDNPKKAGKDWDCFPGDTSVRKNQSEGADTASDWTARFTVASPLVFELVRGFEPRLANFATVYGQTIGANILVNSMVKQHVARPRPCTYPEGVGCKGDKDKFASFYSGHSSNAFVAATAGSLMLTEGLDNSWMRGSFWAYELGLAAATANMRVKAGKHYYSDVLVGAGMGVLVGTMIPALHGVKPYAFSRKPTFEDWGPDLVGMVVGLSAGIVTTELAFRGAASQSTADVLTLLGALQVNASNSDGAVVSLGGAF